MVLLNLVIEVFDLQYCHAISQQPCSFEVSNVFGIDRMLVDIDHMRYRSGGIGVSRVYTLRLLSPCYVAQFVNPFKWTSPGHLAIEFWDQLYRVGIATDTESPASHFPLCIGDHMLKRGEV